MDKNIGGDGQVWRNASEWLTNLLRYASKQAKFGICFCSGDLEIWCECEVLLAAVT